MDDHKNNDRYTEFLYARLQRRGYLLRDVQRMVNQDRNVFAACAVALGDADGMVTGPYPRADQALEAIRLAIDTKPGSVPFGLSMVVTPAHDAAGRRHAHQHGAQRRSNCASHRDGRREPDAGAWGQSPRVALCSHASFGQPQTEGSARNRGGRAAAGERRRRFRVRGRDERRKWRSIAVCASATRSAG